MKKNGFYFSLAGLFLLTIFALVFFQNFNYQRHLGHLYLNVANSNATVYLDSQELGTPPLIDYQTPAGFYQLKIVTPYYTYTTPLRLSPQTATIVDWQAGSSVEKSSGLIYELIPLDLAAAKGENQVLIQTLPDRALLIFANSTEKNFTPYQSDQLINFQSETATLSLPGYINLNFNFTPVAGYQLKITAKLAKDSLEVE